MSDTKAKIEEEQALIVRADDPLDVFERIAALNKLAGTKVGVPTPSLVIDRHFDTADNAIKASKSSLRIRTIDGKPFITMKGKNKSLDGSSKRSELEIPWPYEEPSAFDLVELFGLVEKQCRVNNRTSMNLTRWMFNKDEKQMEDRIVAELALDDVTYKFPNKTEARIFEVEIEIKDEGEKLIPLVTSLKSKFPELYPWSHSKFSTGKIAEYTLQVNTDENNILTDRSFDIIEFLLASSVSGS